MSVEDSKKSINVWFDDFNLSEGGVGDERVKLVIKSDDPDPPKYYVAIYAIPKKVATKRKYIN